MIWLLLSPEMNFGGRFQYALLPIMALSWFPLVRNLADAPRLAQLMRILQSPVWRLRAVVAVICLLALRLAISTHMVHEREGNYDVALLLRQYADRGYTIATTEAGLLPLYSEWRAVDTWGLNDRWIAREGMITPEYLAQQNPAIIMWHDYSSTLHALSHPEGPWAEMMRTLARFAEDHGFVLAAAFAASSEDTDYYWVAADLPDCTEIVERIRKLSYPSRYTGEPARNLAGDAGELRTCKHAP